MGYVKPELIIKAIDENDCRFFTIKEGGRLIQSQQDPDLTKEDAIELFKETIGSYDSGILDITICNKNNKQRQSAGRGYTAFEYRIKISNMENSGATGGSFALLKEIQDLRVDMVKKEEERKREDLQRQIDEMKKDKGGKYDGVLKELIGTLKPLALAHFSKGTVPAASALNGLNDDASDTDTPTETKTVMSEEDKIRMRNALKKLKKYDPNFIENIVLLADFAATQTQTYLSFIPTLKTMCGK